MLFFGMLKDSAGTSSEMVELKSGSSVRDFLAHCESRYPALKSFLPSVAVAVNQQYAGPDTPLNPEDEVALLPPVSGGAQSQRAAIVREAINTADVLTALKRPEDGAAVVFEGVVRNHTRDRKTLYLDYEAYEGMALEQLESLASQSIEKFQIREVAIVHRLGRLEIGEISVLIVVASAHRGPAFDACRWLIDTLKRTVPIWKKEFFEDGAVWADGEPFPVEIPRANS